MFLKKGIQLTTGEVGMQSDDSILRPGHLEPTSSVPFPWRRPEGKVHTKVECGPLGPYLQLAVSTEFLYVYNLF